MLRRASKLAVTGMSESHISEIICSATVGENRQGKAKTSTWSMSTPAEFRHQVIASAGKSEVFLTRLSRSSSTAATNSPSITRAAAAS